MHFIKRFGGELARLVAFAVIFGAATSSATLYKWSQTAATNATADATINWAEGMAPSAVNDSARAMMAAVSKYRDDNNGSLTTGGTSTAYTLTTNQAFASLVAMHGQTIRVKMSVTNGASPTINVDGLGVKVIVYNTSLGFVDAGILTAGSVYDFSYDNNNNGGQWIVVGSSFAKFSYNEIPSGYQLPFLTGTCPTGWTQNTSATLNDAALRLVTGTGGGTNGSALFSVVFAARTIGQANLPSYTLPNTLSASITDPGHTHSGIQTLSAYAPGAGNALQAGGAGTVSGAFTGITATINGGVTSGGSGTAMDFATKYADFIVCIRN